MKLLFLLLIAFEAAATSRTLQVGNNLDSLIAVSSAGDTIVIAAGLHRLQGSSSPKNAMTFIGEDGAILSGARKLTAGSWVEEYPDSLWYYGSQTQEGTALYPCQSGYSRCSKPEELFFNDTTRVKHVASLADVHSDTSWYFDYTNDRIYIGFNPASKDSIETSVTTAFILGSRNADNLYFYNLTIEKYANPGPRGAIDPCTSNARTSCGRGWTMRRITARYNHGCGVVLDTLGTLKSSIIHHSGYSGLESWRDSTTIDSCIFHTNNQAYFDMGYAGTFKVLESNGGVVTNSIAHDNNGQGMWWDVNNINITVRNNTSYNNRNSGFFYEISYNATIQNNVAYNNGHGNAQSWWSPGILIAASGGVASDSILVSCNQLYGNYNAIWLNQQSRGTGTYGRRIIRNVKVRNNAIHMGAGSAGAQDDWSAIGDSLYSQWGNTFSGNKWVTSTLGAAWKWSDGTRSFATWQSTYGLDTDGSAAAAGSPIPTVSGCGYLGAPDLSDVGAIPIVRATRGNVSVFRRIFGFFFGGFR